MSVCWLVGRLVGQLIFWLDGRYVTISKNGMELHFQLALCKILLYIYCVACISSLLKDLGNDRRLPTLKRLSIFSSRLGHFWLSWLSSKRTKMVLLYSGIFENRTLDSNIRKFLFLFSCQIYQRCLCFLRNTCGTT